MKQSTNIIFAIFMSFFLIFSGNAMAEISYGTQSYLNNKDFRTAKISIESDIKKDKYDAKTWYFYSRILYQLNQPNAAKQALNNAMNIDKTASFAKGGMSTVKGFAGDIMSKIKSSSYEDPVQMDRITGSEYDRYLSSVFGSNNPYSNQNPPSSAAIKSALAKKNTVVQKPEETKYTNNTVVQSPPIMSVPVSNVKSSTSVKNEVKTTEDKQGGGFLKGFIVFLAVVLFIALTITYFIQRNVKKTEEAKNQKEKDKIVDLFNKFNALSNKIEEKVKDYEAMIPGTKLYESTSQLYTESLNYIKSIDFNDVSSGAVNKINKNMASVQEYMTILDNAYNNKDYELTDYFKKQEEEKERKIKEEKRLAEIRRKEEERAAIAKQEREKLEREERIKREEREAEIEKERVRTGYYDRQAQRQRERERERELDRERERERDRERQQYRNNNGRSSVGDMVTGAAIYSIADDLLNSNKKSKNNDDDNNSIWGGGSSSSRSDDNNDSVWNSGSSRDDSNDSLWEGSNDSDDSNNW